MESLLFSFALIAVSFAAFQVQRDDQCTPGTKYTNTERSSFFKICRIYGKQRFGQITGCIGPNKEEVAFGDTADHIRTPSIGAGFRFQCIEKRNGESISYQYRPIACVFGKGQKFEAITTSSAILPDYNMNCTCSKLNDEVNFACQMLK